MDRVWPIPSVIHLRAMVKRPRTMRKLTRIEVFSRDHYTCQYCGKQFRQLTLDHVVPRHQGGEHTWENVVSCCEACNCRKAGRTPAEAGMHLVHHPVAPRDGSFFVPYQHLRAHTEWHKFLSPGTAC
jgi:5-methylcytosine-specific restriction endonuclease McrA